MFKAWWECLNMILLQISYRVSLWKKIENQLIFDEVMGKSFMSVFLTQSVYVCIIHWHEEFPVP